MAEPNDTASAPPSRAGTGGGGGFELRLERGAVHVRLEAQPVAPGIRLERLTLQLPDVKFPFEVGRGAGQFRHRLADLVELSVTVEPAAAEALLAPARLAAVGLEDVRLAPRDGFVEIAGRLSGGPAFTLEAGLLAAGDQGVALVLHAPRVLGDAPVPAAALPHLARSALATLGPEALPAAPVPALLRRILAPRGWKLPRTGEVRLARATVAGGAARLVWERAAPAPAASSTDSDVLAADEGARTFREAEALLARGDAAAARDAYLAAGPAATAHPFAAERLLSLLALEERFHEEALDLAAEWLARRPGFEPALAAEATIRAARGEVGRAAAALCALAKGAAARGRAFLALAAAEAALDVPGAPPDERLRAVDLALGLRRDHLPALRALRDVARARGDREGLLRACRRLVAYEPDPAAKARAHADLGQLLLEADPAGARLHLDQALRLGPDDAAAQAALAKACEAAGEPLRAVRALDRLRELLAARGDRAGAARAALDSGALWEGPLSHPENALLRYRDAAELAPSTDATARAARAATAAGQWAEAADLHAATLASLDLAAPGAAELALRTRLALADVAEARLGDPAAAAAHLAQAAALAPDDAPLLRRLLALERSLGRAAEVLRTLDRLAPLEPEGPARAAVLAEAGEAALSLGLAGDARSRFTAAIAGDPACRPALLGASTLARERGDAPAERDALEKLLPLATPGEETADVLDRLASARERAGDVAGAVAAAAAARAAIPTPARLAASIALARRAGDPGALAALLAERARASAAAGDAHDATEAWLERARLVAASPAEALAALAEARALSPGDAGVLRAQADLAERTGDPRLALGCLRALLAGAPEDAAALELRAARAAIAAGEIAAARDHAERALAADVPGAAEVLDEILARVGDDAARADVLARLGRHLDAARLLERHGDLAGARAALERAAAEPATAARALPRLAELRRDSGDRAGAAAALLALARLAEGREAARIALQAWATAHDPAALDLAADRDPGFAPARARRAALRAEGDPRGALADAEAALAGDGLSADERPALLALAARTAAASGDGAAARRHLAAYCEAVPDDDAALERLAGLERAAGDGEALAAALVRRLPRARGADAVRVRLELSALLAAAEPARAARLALDALSHDPASVEALRALTTPPRAAALPAADRAALLARLAAASPADAAAAHGARALLLAEAGERAAALDAAREAARLAEEPDDVLELHARLAEERGDTAEAARAHLDRARRAAARDEPQAAERLADAGLRALAAGVDGGEDALRAALARTPERETARAALEALAGLARARGDGAGERALLPPLVPLLPTGGRPAALLRLSTLALAAGDVAVARASAQEARTLAPRDLAAVEACRAAAQAGGDLHAVADLLADVAALEPDRAGPRLLERARLLAGLGRAPEADAAYRAALAALPPDRALADEQARLRREALPARSPAEPVEAFALRCADPAEAASALRAAAALALAADDPGGALRCARRAWARTSSDPGFAGPLLARVLYLLGSVAEALVVHRRLLDAGVAAVAADDAVALCRQAADLAASAGERDLALRALDELLRLRPQDVEAAVERFALEPDRARAVRALVDSAGACRSRRGRVLATAAAAEATLVELRDAAQGEALFARARAEAAPSPGLALSVARRRAAAVRAAEGATSQAHLEALHDAAAAAEAAGDRGAARDVLEEAIALERERGLFSEAAHDLLQLDALAAADGDFAESPARLRAAAALLREAGDVAGAVEALRVAWAANPESEETARRLEELLRDGGPSAAGELAELLNDRAARARPGEERAAALVVLAAARRDADDGAGEEAALRAALAELPGHPAAERRLLELLEASHRTAERARLLLERSARLTDEAARLAGRREAARALGASADAEDRDLAAEAWRSVAAADPADLEAARAAAGVLLGLGRREDAIPHLETLVRAEPGDDAAAGELSIAYADRPAERAALFLARAAHAAGERRAEHLREAAGALFASGDADRARATLREAFEAWPADAAAFEEAVRDATGDVDRLDAVLARRAAAVPEEAASCHRARGDALRATGRSEAAVGAYEAARAAAPDDVGVVAALATALAESRGDGAAVELDRLLVARAGSSPGDVPAQTEAQARYRLGLALSFAGASAEAVPHLERALALAPHDPHAGLGWSAVAQGYADRGDAASALAAARARVERAAALGLETEQSAALDAEAELASRFGLPSALGPAAIELAAVAGTPPLEEAELERAVAFEPHAGEAAPEEPVAVEPHAGEAVPEEPVAFEPHAGEAVPEEPVAFEPHAGEAVPEEPVAFEPPPEEAASGDAGEEPGAFDGALEALPPEDAAARAAGLIADAAALARSGGAPDAIRAALDGACDVDPDAAGPWRERARLEEELGDPLAAARSHLAVWLRSEGEDAVEAALAAARLFEAEGQHGDAARAYRAALHVRPDAVPVEYVVASEALAAGDAPAAARLLSALDPAAVPEALRAAHARTLGTTLAAEGKLEPARAALAGALERDPADAATARALAALDGRTDDWAALAAATAAEGAQALDAAEGAARYLHAARLLRDRAGDTAGAIAALRAAVARARGSELPAARRTSAEAMALLEDLGVALPALTPAPVPEESLASVAAEELARAASADAEPGLEEAGAPPAPPPELAPDPRAIARAGRALMEQGDWEAAYAQLSLALEREPSDLTLARDLSRVAEKLRRWDEYVLLGEVCADAISPYDPLAAAARYRHFAQVLRERLAAPDRAGPMLEKALALVPDDPDTRRELIAVWSEQPATAPRALDAWLDLARKDPTDAAALEGVARAAGRLAGAAPERSAAPLRERARVAAALAALAAPGRHPAPPPARVAAQISAELRARVAAPGAAGALARVLEQLAPWLETLFPADSRRRGAGPEHRLDPARAPALAAALDAAAAALAARPVARYLVDRPQVEVALENTQPPALVLSTGAAALDDAALAFLAARTLDLVNHGSTLVAKFAPRDVGILLELACRFAGGSPPSLGLPAERAGAFFAVLEATVPAATRAAVRPLAGAAAQELAGLDPRALAAALRRTANRVALLYAGDPAAAIRTLALLDRRLEGGAVDPGQALSAPDARDLALFALSDAFLELRAAAVG